MSLRTTLIIPVLVMVVLVLIPFSTPTVYTSSHRLTSSVDRDVVEEKIIDAYRLVYRLGKMGVDVRDLVDRLDEAQKLLDEGRLDEANNVVESVLDDARRLEEEAGMIVFMNNFSKGVTVFILGIIPVLSYFFLPRIYLELWFRFKKKWLVIRK